MSRRSVASLGRQQARDGVEQDVGVKVEHPTRTPVERMSPLILIFLLERADEAGRVGGEGDQLGHRLASLGDDDPVRVDAVEQGQALLLEFGGRNLFMGTL